MHIDWDSLSVREWYDIYRGLPKTNLVQSYAYAKAMRQVHLQNTSFGAIRNPAGDIMGLVQMQHVSVLGFKRVFVDRGPLWINRENFGHQRKFWQLIANQYPSGFFLKRRFIPEIENSAYAENLFNQLDFEKAGDGYQTIWLDLKPDEDTLFKNLDGKWRNTLRRAQEAPLDIDIDTNSRHIDELLKHYMSDRLEKNYAGASPKFIQALERHKSSDENSFIITAKTQDGHTCAMMYFWIHGTSATYQIGWSNDEGRSHSAHYAMMWRAIQHLKDKSVDWLDMGGIQPDTAEGVTRFKKGLSGQTFETSGIYI